MWGFGKKRDAMEPPENPPKDPSPEAEEGKKGVNEGKDKKKETTYKGGSGFDPTGLERAAKAAKFLDKSSAAKYALDVVRVQNETKQEEFRMKQRKIESW